MANKIETNSKNFKPRINLNHNMYKKAVISAVFQKKEHTIIIIL